MLDVPISVYLSWPKPSAHPVTRGPELWIFSSIFLSLATISVGARLYSRIFIRHWFGLDDFLIVIAYFSSIGVTVCVAIGNTRFGWNKHVWDMPISSYSPSLRTLYYSRIFWGIATSCVRLSILSLYYRLLDRCQAPRHMRWVLHGMTAFTVGLLLEYIGTGIFPCWPIKAYWVWPEMADPIYCIDDGKSLLVTAIINTISEFLIALLPVIAVFRLHVDPKQRWSVVGLLSLSFLVAIAGIFRTFFVFKAINTHDLTWWSTPQWLTSEVEIDVALTCACAAPLRPLIGSLVRRAKGVSTPIRTAPRKASHATFSSKATSSTGLDHEGVTNWTTLTSRTIDLEGIGEDGFGYTVTITGPPKRRHRLTKYKPKAIRIIEEGPPQSSGGRHRKLSKTSPLEVKTERSFQITETFQESFELSEKSSRRGPLNSPLTSEDQELEIERAAAGLREWDIGEAYGDYDSDRGFVK